MKMGLWGEEKLREYREKMESENVGSPEEGVDEMIAKLNEETDRIRKEVRSKGNGEASGRGWWNEECRKSKDGVKECVSKWRKG